EIVPDSRGLDPGIQVLLFFLAAKTWMAGTSPAKTTRVASFNAASSHELAAELVLDVDADDVVEILLGGGEAELARTRGLEIAGPAGDDAHDEGIRLALDAPGDLLAGDALQGRDLLADSGGKTGHGEAAPGTCGGEIHGRGMQ